MNVAFIPSPAHNGFSLGPITIAGITVSIATAPHALTGQSVIASADGTHVDATMDTVQVSVSVGTISIADLRVGHLVASATVPATMPVSAT